MCIFISAINIYSFRQLSLHYAVKESGREIHRRPTKRHGSPPPPPVLAWGGRAERLSQRCAGAAGPEVAPAEPPHGADGRTDTAWSNSAPRSKPAAGQPDSRTPGIAAYSPGLRSLHKAAIRFEELLTPLTKNGSGEGGEEALLPSERMPQHRKQARLWGSEHFPAILTQTSGIS